MKRGQSLILPGDVYEYLPRHRVAHSLGIAVDLFSFRSVSR